MSGFTWTLDAPSGVYKSHTLTPKLLKQSVADSTFFDHAQPVEGFGKNMGDTATLTRIAALSEPTDAELTENEDIPESNFEVSTRSITVAEYGRQIKVTSLMKDLNHFNPDNPIQKELMRQQTLVTDTLIASAFKSTLVKYAPTGAASNNIATSGTFGATATTNMNVWHLEQIKDYLYDTLLAPPVKGGDYIGIFRHLALRGIMNDTNWEKWHQYTDPDSKYNDEIGRIAGIRCIGTNHSNALAKKGTGSVLGEGVVFGDDAVALAELIAPELRAVAIPESFGRRFAVAWYQMLKAALIWNTANAGQCRVIHVGSL